MTSSCHELLFLGITGLQWRKQLPPSVSVTLNDKQKEAFDCILQSCKLNNILTTADQHEDKVVAIDETACSTVLHTYFSFHMSCIFYIYL